MRKLGEVLLSIGALSADVLDRALMLQRSTGGRLGTILLERGIITEETLARALSNATGCGYAHWERVKNASRDVVALLPAKVAIRAGAVPFEREGRLLRVAMRDPNDLASEDEIAFVTGKKIESWSIAEFRLAEALEHYYGERRSARFRVLTERIEKGIRPAGAPPPFLPPPPELRGEPNLSPPPPAETPRSDFWTGAPGSVDEIEIATWRPVPFVKPSPTAPPAELEFARERDEIHPSARKRQAVPVSLEETRARIRSAETRDDIADAALAYVAPAYRLVALFIARKHDVIGWQARGEGVSRSAFKAVRMPFHEPSIFLNVKLSGTPYQGKLPELPAHAAFFEALDHQPERCAVFPVAIRKRVVAFLLLEIQTPVLSPARTDEMKALAAAIAGGLAALVLQHRKSPA